MDALRRLQDLKRIHPDLFLITSTIYSHSTEATFWETIQYIQEHFPLVKSSPVFIRGEVRDPGEKAVEAKFYKDFLDKSCSSIDPAIRTCSFMALKAALDWMSHEVVLRNYYQQTQVLPCQAGRKLVVIYENGEVFPCELLDKPFGNLRDAGYDMMKLLFSGKAQNIKKDIFPGKCCSCTWENIIIANLAFHPASYPRIFYHWARLFLFRKRR